MENHKAFSDVIKDIWSQTEGTIGSFILSDEEIINIAKKATLIVNPFSVNCNEKKILNRIYSELAEISKQNLFNETSELNSTIINYLDDVIAKLPYSLKFGLDMDITGLFKLYQVEILEDSERLLEHIIDYIRIMHNVCEIEIFVFVNLRQFLEKKELLQLYEFASYQKINIIIIEGVFQGKNNDSEQCVILDKDLCIIKID